MKKITKQFLFCALSLSALTFVSCDNKDDATGDSTLEVAQGVAGTINMVSPLATTQTVNEADETAYTYTITLNKPQSVDIHVRVIQTAGSAISGEDFTFDNDILIPAYATSATGSINILNDDAVEGVEDFTLQIGTTSTANASLTPMTVSFTINNYVSTDLDLTFNFNKAFSISGTDYTLCGIGYDMDYYVLDAGLNDLGIYDAATAACPEHLVVDAARFPDGTYYIYYDIYDDGGVSGVYHNPFDVPTTVDYFRAGAIAPGTFTQEAAFVPSSTAGSGYDYVITIKVLNGVYTLENSIPEVIVSGKSTKVKAAIEQARRNRRK